MTPINRELRFAVLISLIGFLPLGAAQAGGTDLWETYQQAVKNDPKLKAALHRKDGALESVPQSRAALLPSANLSAQRSRYEQNTQDKDKYDASGFNLSINMPILHLERWAGLNMAETGVRMAKISFDMAQQEQILRVAERYFNILSAAETLSVALAEETAMERQLSLATEGLATGTAIITDVQEAQTGVDFAKAQVVAARNTVIVRQRELTELIGPTDGLVELAPLKKEIPLKEPDPSSAEQWVVTGMQGNLGLQITQAKLQQATQGVEKARSGHLPTVDLSAGHQFSDSEGSNFWTGGVPTTKTNYMTMQMNLPLFAGGATQSQVRQSLRAEEEARFEEERSRNETETAIRSAYLDVSTGIAQAQAYAKALTSSSSALQTTRESHAAGLRTTLDVLNAEKDVFRAMRNLADARYRYILGALRLKFTAGQLSGQDLSNINEWLQK